MRQVSGPARLALPMLAVCSGCRQRLRCLRYPTLRHHRTRMLLCVRGPVLNPRPTSLERAVSPPLRAELHLIPTENPTSQDPIRRPIILHPITRPEARGSFRLDCRSPLPRLLDCLLRSRALRTWHQPDPRKKCRQYLRFPRHMSRPRVKLTSPHSPPRASQVYLWTQVLAN